MRISATQLTSVPDPVRGAEEHSPAREQIFAAHALPSAFLRGRTNEPRLKRGSSIAARNERARREAAHGASTDADQTRFLPVGVVPRRNAAASRRARSFRAAIELPRSSRRSFVLPAALAVLPIVLATAWSVPAEAVDAPDASVAAPPSAATPAPATPPPAVGVAEADAGTEGAPLPGLDLLTSKPPTENLVPADSPEVKKLEVRQRELDEMVQEAKEFDVEAKEFRKDTAELIKRKLEEKREELAQFYDRQIKAVEEAERQNRGDAIAVFERFIQLYPDDAKYTPDAMARLAELYYEKTVDDQQLALASYEERAKLGAEEAPPEQTRSFEKSIALYQRIIDKFPGYRLLDSIYYLLGWCQNEQGQPENARDTFFLLTQRFPKSHYVPEAWVRIGEYWFDYTPDKPNDLQAANDAIKEAIKAYQNAITFKESALFDKALYKLGWSYFRINDYDDAVDTFVKLIDYYDDQKKAGKEGGGDLRAEALQYTAVSFADENWGKTHTLAEYFRTRGQRSYEYELFKKLGDIFFDETRYGDAITAYREVIARNPVAPDAPQTQERIVQCYARQQDRDTAFRERSVLIATYNDRSPWAKANAGNAEALQAANELIEKTALLSAQYYHEQAEEYSKEAADANTPPEQKDQKSALALQAYRSAATAYEHYLKQFPRSKNLYDISFLYAQTLFRSLQFKLAAEAFARVRDSNADNKYLVDSAYYVVLSLQREIDQEERLGLLERREPCTVDSCKNMKEFKPQAIPDVRLELVSAADIYLQRVPTAEDAPALSYAAGQTYFRYFHFDEARDRYEDLIKRFPDKDQATFAAEDELVAEILLKDWVAVEKLASHMLELKSVKSDPKKFADKRLVKYSARFEIAGQLMQRKDWEGAAKTYLSVVDDTDKDSAKFGKWEQADKALFNAATCYKAEFKFDSAMRTYERLYTDYPNSSLAEQSLFFVAENAEKAFEFDKAIDRYRLLVKTYPKSNDAQAAQFNAARRLEALQRYREAADEYAKYATTFSAQPDAPDMAFQSAIMFQRMHDTWGLISGLQKFVQKFSSKPDQHERVIAAQLMIANAYTEVNKSAEAHKAIKQTVEDFDRYGMKSDNYTAAQAASEAAFDLAEEDLQEFDAAKFEPKGHGAALTKNVTDQLTHLAERLKQIKEEYLAIILKYRWPEWSTASLYRVGYADEGFANKILQSPCPKDIKALGEDACEQYQASLADKMSVILDRAETSYETAVDKARELRVVNKWTKLAMEKVCSNVPSKCGSMKDPREQLISESLSPLPLTADVNGSRSVMYDPPPAPKPQQVAPQQQQQQQPQGQQPGGIGAPPQPGAPQPVNGGGGGGVVVPLPNTPAPAGAPPPSSTSAAPANAPAKAVAAGQPPAGSVVVTLPPGGAQ
jgi:TolA-binding protein